MISLDTECTGLDLHHGAKPFLVTVCDEEGVNTWWEWDVDPLTREPQIIQEDLDDISIDTLETLDVDASNDLVLQNPKFDVAALNTLNKSFGDLWWWDRTRDTLMAGHLLNSKQAHDLATMVLVYLNKDLGPYEDTVKKATNEAQSIAQGEFFEWRIAKKGLSEMPSVKGTAWKNDMWLPRAVAKEKNYPTGECEVVNVEQTNWAFSSTGILIDRKSKWGNPFKIGLDGNRSKVIELYREYLRGNQRLLKSLPELDGKVLGCHCKPNPCHGDVLVAEVAKLAHPWWTVASDYANADSAATLSLFKRQRKILKERGLWAIYLERLKVLPVVYKMESRRTFPQGVTLNRSRLEESTGKYTQEAKKAAVVCLKIASKYSYDLALPKSGANNSLREFVFERLNLKANKRSKKTSAPSMDKSVLEYWEATLPKGSDGLNFIQALGAKRKRDTALQYMEGYQRFWLPLDDTWRPEEDDREWFQLYPSLNPTGTDTLRFSCSNPNLQQVSKQETTNLRYCFGPAPGREWWSLDAKNIELRIPAYEAGETEMIDLFERPDDPPYYGSVHLLMFSIVYPREFKSGGDNIGGKYPVLYGRVKGGDFAIQYGSVESSGTADRAYGVPGVFNKIKKRFRKIHGPGGLNDRMIAIAEDQGYVETMPDKTVDPIRGYPLQCTYTSSGRILPTVPLNYHVQGTAGWWMCKAMVRVQEYLDELNGYYMIMQVHDELVFDFPKSLTGKGNLPKIHKIRKLMEQGGDDIGVPTPVSIAYHPKTWSKGVSV